jgi:hypothetical protein
MKDEQEQATLDEQHSALIVASNAYAFALRNFSRTNAWPERPVPGPAMNTLAVELWGNGFDVTEITSAYEGQ